MTPYGRLSVRLAREEDLDSILAIESAWETTPHWTRPQFAAELSRAPSLFLAACAEEGAVSGYGVAWVVEKELQLLSLAVHPAAARRGTGRALLEALLEQGRARGCVLATLEVAEGNSSARGLYEASGFRAAGRRPGFYPDGSAAVLMDKTL